MLDLPVTINFNKNTTSEAQMQIFLKINRYIIPLLIISFFLACAADEVDEPKPIGPPEPQQFGTVSGIVTDAITGNPLPGVQVTLAGMMVETEVDGGFVYNDISYGEEKELMVSDMLYQPYSNQIVLNEVRLVNNVALSPLTDHQEGLDAVLEDLSTLLESLDMDNLPSLQSLFSESYFAADDEATQIGVNSGVVPPNFEGVVPTFTNVFEQYSWLSLTYDNLVYDITHARKASIQMLMSVDSENAEDKNMRSLEGSCRFDFRREGSDWKIVYWQLMSLNIKL